MEKEESDLFHIEDGVLTCFFGKDLELDCVDIPASVVRVDDRVFTFSKMRRVRFSDGCVSIGDRAFFGCENLESADLPSSLRFIGAMAFADCTSLKKIEIPGGVKKLELTFFHCEGLREVELSEGVETLGRLCLTYSAVERLSLPASVREISPSALDSTDSLRKIDVAKGSLYFKTEGGVLYSGDGKTLVLAPRSISKIAIPEGVEKIGDCAFDGCKDLAAVSIPRTVREIGGGAFRNCKSLKSVDIPQGVGRIESSTFFCCESLERVNIPKSVSYIGVYAFQWCSALSSLHIPDGVEALLEGTLDGCDALSALKLPAGLKIIKSHAIFDCRALESLVIPASVGLLGVEAICGCNNLSKVVFEDPAGWMREDVKNAEWVAVSRDVMQDPEAACRLVTKEGEQRMRKENCNF